MNFTNVVHLLKLVFLLFFTCLWTPHAAQWVYVSSAEISSPGDSLNPGDTLNSSTYIVSAKGTFALGFFHRIDGTINKTYLAISKIADQSSLFNVFVWFGSRDRPIVNNSGMFTLDNKGTLKIVPQGGDPVVLYSSPQPTENTVATLLDSGNFILKEMHSNGSMKRVLWQSFDYPGDTLWPGMKLGVSHKTGQTWSLTSWLTDEIPVPGPCKLEWDPKGCQLIIRQRGEVYWTSGFLKRGNRFKSISLDVTSMYNFVVVSNEDEEYFSFSNRNQSLMSEWLLTPMGQLKDLKGLDIARADHCYGYNTNGGCQRWKQPECRHHGDTFDLISGYLVAGDLSVNYNSSLSISDCRAICWKNCGCVAFTSWFHNDTGCRFWTGNWSFLSGHLSALPSIFVLSSNPSQSGTKNWIWIGISIAIAIALLIISLCYRLRRKVVSKGNNITKDEKELLDLVTLERSSVNDISIDGKKEHDLRVFSYARVAAATNNFSSENMLGKGGFGPVYMGHLLTGQNVAIKRLSKFSNQGIHEFKNELILISKLQHMNLVKLLGCCIHEEERMLIYEYMPNKSLDYFLFDQNRSKLLDWKKRFNIIEGIIQGLIYLHKYSRLRVIHRDLKAWDLWQEGEGIQLVDPTISDSCVNYQVLRCIHVSLLCVEDSAIDRPTMSDVLFMLTNENMPLPLPKKLAFSIGRKAIGATILDKESNAHSVNGLSISEMNAR